MNSTLIVTSVGKLQKEIINSLKKLKEGYGVYVSLNKTQKSIEEILKKNSINTNNIFFIDCVTAEKIRDDVLHIHPDQLEMLCTAIKSFIKDIKGKKYLVIDALATLLIYNSENDVAKFIKQITECSSEHGVKLVAFSPKTRGEELLNKIFNFFDEVKEK